MDGCHRWQPYASWGRAIFKVADGEEIIFEVPWMPPVVTVALSAKLLLPANSIHEGLGAVAAQKPFQEHMDEK